MPHNHTSHIILLMKNQLDTVGDSEGNSVSMKEPPKEPLPVSVCVGKNVNPPLGCPDVGPLGPVGESEGNSVSAKEPDIVGKNVVT
mmetsp:Transcript_28438/g.34645  ORF Transcript_28438/g.34645 Transcript_28438/m.34645 type:complete len:86 (-) Transcript_28438:96-353(-)